MKLRTAIGERNLIHKGWPVNLISRAKHQAGHQPCQAECLGYVFLRLVPRDRRGGRVGTFRERSGGMLPESSTNFYPQKAMFPFSKEPEQCVTCVSPMNLLMFSDRKIMSPSWVTTAMKPSKAFRYRLSICWSASASDSFSEQTGKTRGLDGMHACGVKQMQVALTNVCQEWCEGIK